MLDRRALRARLERVVDAGGMEREVLSDAAGVDRDAGVLADEVLLILRDLDVADDRLAQVLRDVLQRTDVQVGGCALDDAGEMGGDLHARTAPSISSQRSAIV